MRLLLLLVVIFSITVICESFAEWMITDFCHRKLAVGQVIMHARVIQADDRSLLITREGEPLQDGDYYVPGETLDVDLNIPAGDGDTIFETSNAIFLNGGCEGRRIASPHKATLKLPSDGEVTIVAGWAPSHTAVKLTKTIRLIPFHVDEEL